MCRIVSPAYRGTERQSKSMSKIAHAAPKALECGCPLPLSPPISTDPKNGTAKAVDCTVVFKAWNRPARAGAVAIALCLQAQEAGAQGQGESKRSLEPEHSKHRSLQV